MAENGETAPLLAENVPNLARTNGRDADADAAYARARRAANVRAITYAVLSAVFVIALVSMLFFWDRAAGRVHPLPSDPHDAALAIMEGAPAIVSSILP